MSMTSWLNHPTSRSTRWALAARWALVAAVGAATLPVAAARAQTSATATGIDEFKARVAEYVELRTSVEAKMPPLVDTKDPVKLTARQKALASAVIEARAGAAAGDVFVKACQPALTRIVRDDFARRARADRKALMQDVPAGTKVQVNAEYPDGLPLVTIPPRLLKALPELSQEIEYRLVGRDLILLDVRSGVVVDMLPGVVPA
jgi:hypothetical protein